jgi:hypothetical protein
MTLHSLESGSGASDAGFQGIVEYAPPGEAESQPPVVWVITDSQGHCVHLSFETKVAPTWVM